MYKTKLLASILVAIAVLFAQVGLVAAAPATQDTTPITGTIQSITTETDANGVTTVLVTLVDAQGATQTVRLSEETAAGFIVGQTVNIDPTTVIPDTTEEQEPV